MKSNCKRTGKHVLTFAIEVNCHYTEVVGVDVFNLLDWTVGATNHIQNQFGANSIKIKNKSCRGYP